MTFYSAFWSVLRYRPDRALAALYWLLTGRKVRARNRLRLSLAQGPDVYRNWIYLIESEEASAGGDDAEAARWTMRPLVSVLLHQPPGLYQAALDAVIRSLEAQSYAEWELVVAPCPDGPPLKTKPSGRVRVTERAIADGGEALAVAAAAARGDYLLPLPAGAILPPTALFRYVEALQDAPVDLLFGDHDEIDAHGQRHAPWFKPHWNAELALAQDYASQAMLVSATAARPALRQPLPGDRAAAYALALAVACRPDAVVRHVGHVQAHLGPGADAPADADRQDVVRGHLAGSGATVHPGDHGTIRVDWPLPDPRPLVSILIPTRDRIDLLGACIASLDELTGYRPFEVIVVDNGSVRPESLAYFRDLATRDGFRVIRDERPYNFSQLNNLAVEHARGDYLCLLNNDTEVIDGDWLAAMMRQAIRPHVGAVGAKLLYDDGSIQHAGVTVGLGEAAGHAHRFQPRDAEGYFARAHAAHYVSAVTAACLVVEKRKFLAVGGLDEERLAIAFNDVDLCLKLEQAGWRNLYTPHATLLHHESKSRGKDFSPQHIDRYRRELATLQERWGTRTYDDPLHHPRLDRSSERYLIRL